MNPTYQQSNQYSAPVQSNQYEQQSAQFAQHQTQFTQQPTQFSQQPTQFAQQPTHFAQQQPIQYEQPPILPERPQEQHPGLPPRPAVQDIGLTGTMNTQAFAPPPQRQQNPAYQASDEENTYLRDPHRLTGYLIPLPQPTHHGLFHSDNEKTTVPQRFLIYTPPPPPLQAPAEGEKESKAHKVQRKWQEEVRQAKQNPQKIASWKGVKGRVTKGINWAIGQTTNSNLDFLNRIPGTSSGDHDKHADDGYDEGDETHKTVGLEEMVLQYPASLPGSPEQIRQEFVDNMLRSKSKAQKDAIIATGLLPVAAAIDICATLIWPFGGLLEIDGVWAFSSIRGAKTARSVTKRLNSSSVNTNEEGAHLKLTFTPTQRMEVLSRYLVAECHKREPKQFPNVGMQPTESEVLEAIGWSPSQTGGERQNWEDEQWEVQEVKEDFAQTMKKGAKEWHKWVKAFEKDPEKALKK